jgi:hypothetical protein
VNRNESARRPLRRGCRRARRSLVRALCGARVWRRDVVRRYPYPEKVKSWGKSDIRYLVRAWPGRRRNRRRRRASGSADVVDRGARCRRGVFCALCVVRCKANGCDDVCGGAAG